MVNSVFEAMKVWWQSETSQAAVQAGLHGALELAITTLIGTAVLELISWDTVRLLHEKQADGRELYRQAVAVNFFNHFILGIPVYMAAILLFGRPSGGDESLLGGIVRILGIIVIHDICYYEAHKMMHSGPGWYRFHKFHHRFNKYIPPSSANAVSIVEYVLAYITPFAVAALLTHPTEVEMRTAVYIVSVANLLIHTPAYDPTSKYLEAVYLVSERNHTEHHRKLTKNYAAPVFSVDRILELFNGNATSNTKVA